MSSLPESEQRPLSFKGCLFFILMVTVSIFACVSILYVSIDTSCRKDARKWLPDYPGAERVHEEHSWLTPFGIGQTTRVLFSTDPRQEIMQWYTENDKHMGQGGNAPSEFATMRWRLSNAEDGTHIILTSECEPTLALWSN